MVRKIFTRTVYIKVYPNKFELRDIEKGRTIAVTASEPFTTKRLLVGQFSVADGLLRTGMKKLMGDGLLPVRPVVVIQPTSMTEGGLSQVEERVLLELAASSGARKAKVWVGHQLTDDEVVELARRA